MQRLVGAPFSPIWNDIPRTLDEWRAVASAGLPAAQRRVSQLCDLFGIRVQDKLLGGVKAFEVIPANIPPRNRDRLLVHFHGGCYVLNGGEAALPEAILMAGFGGFRIISVDYRMAPDARFPAAHEDALRSWEAILDLAQSSKTAIFGTSAGGALALSTAQQLKHRGLPLPGALGVGTPMSDLTKAGDTFHTNEFVDNILVSPDGFCDAAARLYAGGHELSDPQLSPVYGDFSGLPPTVLTSGTRDLMLSNTVRVHRRMRQAGVIAELHVHEAQSHAHYLRDHSAPETKDVFGEIASFFDRHLDQ